MKQEAKFIGKVKYLEAGKIQSLQIELDNAHKLLELVSKLDDLDILEVHIYREEVK